jgi:predicted MFS family arabinose efflux permease
MSETQVGAKQPTRTRDKLVEDNATGAPPPVRPGLILALVLGGQFMALLDLNIVNVAVPSIQVGLGASGAALQLVVAGYTIAYAVLLITGARLGERLGYGRVFETGLALFTLFSLACGLAPDTPALIGFRVAQGVGAAVMVPQVMSLIQRTFSGASRLRALGVYTAVLATGGLAGQILGGVLVSADLFGSAWRPVFLVNVPIGLVLLAASRRLLPSFPGNPGRSLDLVGLVLLAGAIGLLVVPLVLGHQEHWPVWGWVMFAASAVLATAFAVYERRLAERGGHPLIHRRVLRSPGMVPAAAAIFMVMMAVSGFSFSLTLHLQTGLGESALRAGLTLAPMLVGFGVAGLYWQRLPKRLHRPLPALTMLVATAGFAVLGLWLRGGTGLGVGPEAVMLVVGLAGGCAYSPLFSRALGRVDPDQAADASGVLITVLQLSQVVGVAAVGSVFLSEVSYPASHAASGHALAVVMMLCAFLFLAAAAFAHRTRLVVPRA